MVRKVLTSTRIFSCIWHISAMIFLQSMMHTARSTPLFEAIFWLVVTCLGSQMLQEVDGKGGCQIFSQKISWWILKFQAIEWSSDRWQVALKAAEVPLVHLLERRPAQQACVNSKKVACISIEGWAVSI